MRKAGSEPFPIIYVDGKEGQKFEEASKSRLKKVQKIWVREKYKQDDKAKKESEDAEKRNKNLEEAKKIVIEEDKSLPEAKKIKISDGKKIYIIKLNFDCHIKDFTCYRENFTTFIQTAPTICSSPLFTELKKKQISVGGKSLGTHFFDFH